MNRLEQLKGVKLKSVEPKLVISKQSMDKLGKRFTLKLK